MSRCTYPFDLPSLRGILMSTAFWKIFLRVFSFKSNDMLLTNNVLFGEATAARNEG